MSYQDFYQKSLRDKEAFWAEEAKAVDWFSFPKQILSQNARGFYRWFEGGKLNTCYLALDRHVRAGRGEQVAVQYDSPVTGVYRSITYAELLREVELFAGVLKNLGVGKGDRVVIYMPMIPETVVGMLACARLGAVHSVVFGGFAARELALRIDDAKPKVILTASAGVEVQKILPYQPIVENALEEATFKPDKVVLFQRNFEKAILDSPIYCDWKEEMQKAAPAGYVEVDATDPLYILYTSGTTGKPKGIVRDNGGHAVALLASMKYIYHADPGDVYWAASDVGWVVGHSYIVYAPLFRGCTTVLYEGKPIRTPDAGAFWRVIEDYGVKVMFTAPTAIRAIKKEDPHGALFGEYNTSSLKYLFLAGERCDVATLNWAQDLLHKPVIDHWWQTESGYPMLANPLGIEMQPVKPGSAGLPFVGFDIQILDENQRETAPGQEGAVVIKLPLPPGCLPTLWENDDRFEDSYLSAYPGYYFTGDGGYKDEDGYVYITGRIDDVINVAGHRLSTSDMEEILASHPAVAECAVIGVEDNFKGQLPVGFVVLKAGENISKEQLEKELTAMVRDRVGPIACFNRVAITPRLPKTRSGKILRKTMRHIADGKPFSPPSTIEDPNTLEEIGEIMQQEKIGQHFQGSTGS